jgi:hypothetical protein
LGKSPTPVRPCWLQWPRWPACNQTWPNKWQTCRLRCRWCNNRLCTNSSKHNKLFKHKCKLTWWQQCLSLRWCLCRLSINSNKWYKLRRKCIHRSRRNQ